MCRMKGEVIKPLFSLKPTGPVWAQWTNEDRTAWKQMRKLGINKRTYDFTKGEAKKTTTCFQAKGWEPKRQQPLSRCRGRRRVMSRPWNSRWAWLLPESSSQTLIPEAAESSAPPNAFSDRRKRLFPNYGVSQRGQTVAWQLRSSGTHMAEKEGCPGWRAGPEAAALVPPVPRPQDEVPREKRLSGMFNQARSTGQTWDTLSPISPVHACSLRSARHPDPSAPRAPSSSALLYFFLYIHGSYHLLNMPLFQKYTVYYWLSLPHWPSQDLDLYPTDTCRVPGAEQTLNKYWLNEFTNMIFFKGLCKKKKSCNH